MWLPLPVLLLWCCCCCCCSCSCGWCGGGCCWCGCSCCRCRRRRRRRRRPGIPGGARRRPGVLTTRWRGLTCSAMHLTHTNVNGVLFFQYCAVLNKKVCLKGNFRRPSDVRNVVLAVYAPTGRYIVESGAVCIYLVGRCTCLQTERYPSTNWHRKLTEFHCPDLIKCGYCPLFNTHISIYT